MDPSSSNISGCDDETGALQTLLDAFLSVCSVEEIASAYCKAKGDVTKAGDILYKLQESNSEGVVHELNGESTFSQLEESLYADCPEKSTYTDKYPKGSKPRKLSASLGTVSTILGKKYAGPSLSENGTSARTKPLKLEVHESLMDELDVGPALPGFASQKKDFSDKDVEEFLFSMVGDGSNLSIDAIREVLGSCGYDIKKSMEELLALSTKTLKKVEVVDRYTVPEKSNISREVLESLFTLPEKSEEKPKRNRFELGLNRTRVIGQKAVTKPLEDIASSYLTDIPKKKVEENDAVVEDDDYQLLRDAAKQHRNAMKTYYEAAVDAFTVGDRQRAAYLLEQGKNYNHLAREADEKSAREIIEPRKTETREEVPLDLSALHPREALHLLKLHLNNLANIPSFHYLKVILETGGGEMKKGKRSRMVKKLLEKESIEWIEEEGNPGTIFIKLDQIDPSKLSFLKESD